MKLYLAGVGVKEQKEFNISKQNKTLYRRMISFHFKSQLLTAIKIFKEELNENK